MKRTESIWNTAYHEAGHTVMAWAQRRVILRVRLATCPEEEGLGTGDPTLIGLLETEPSVELPDPDVSEMRETAERDAMLYLAGPVAEGLYCGTRVRVKYADRDGIEQTIGSHHGALTWIQDNRDVGERILNVCRKKYIEWLRLRTRIHLLAYWPLVDAMAIELRGKGTLTGKEVHALFKKTLGSRRPRPRRSAP